MSPIPLVHDVVEVSGSCSRSSTGVVECRPPDRFDQTPTEIALEDRAVQIAASWRNACARLASGVIECWELALADTGTDAGALLVAHEAPSLDGALDIDVLDAMDGPSGCIVDGDHHARCWGAAVRFGSDATPSNPAAVDGDQLYTHVRALGTFAPQLAGCGVTVDGGVRCWQPSAPTFVPGVNDAIDVATDGQRLYVLRADHSVVRFDSIDHPTPWFVAP
jgi:hypothetical protein